MPRSTRRRPESGEIEAALDRTSAGSWTNCSTSSTAMTASAAGTDQAVSGAAGEGILSGGGCRGASGRRARGLEESMAQTRERLEQLNADLSAGAARQQEAQTNLDGCRRELKKAPGGSDRGQQHHRGLHPPAEYPGQTPGRIAGKNPGHDLPAGFRDGQGQSASGQWSGTLKAITRPSAW